MEKIIKEIVCWCNKKRKQKRVCGGGVLCLEAMERRGEKYDFMGGTSSDGTGLLDNVFLFFATMLLLMALAADKITGRVVASRLRWNC